MPGTGALRGGVPCQKTHCDLKTGKPFGPVGHQYGIDLAIEHMPSPRQSGVSVFAIFSFDLTRASSPGCRFSSSNFIAWRRGIGRRVIFLAKFSEPEYSQWLCWPPWLPERVPSMCRRLLRQRSDH